MSPSNRGFDYFASSAATPLEDPLTTKFSILGKPVAHSSPAYLTSFLSAPSRKRGVNYRFRAPEPLDFDELPPEGLLLPAEERELPPDDRLPPADDRELPPDERLLPAEDREPLLFDRLPPTERELGEVCRLELPPTELGERALGRRWVDDPEGDRADGRL